ncbi:hypothetical protein [Vibrio quintilis]|uniref:hypothetical protein n=1 Tax=Vibrio quintilis TaxID=1117707 RepID=UPI0011611E14|nr:hypothetical protein [Vibrio quintilis]
MGYSCRNYLSEREARAKHRSALQKYAKQAKAGTLPVRNMNRIENKQSAVPVEELRRPAPEAFKAGSIFERVAAMGRRI